MRRLRRRDRLAACAAAAAAAAAPAAPVAAPGRPGRPVRTEEPSETALRTLATGPAHRRGGDLPRPRPRPTNSLRCAGAGVDHRAGRDGRARAKIAEFERQRVGDRGPARRTPRIRARPPDPGARVSGGQLKRAGPGLKARHRRCSTSAESRPVVRRRRPRPRRQHRPLPALPFGGTSAGRPASRRVGRTVGSRRDQRAESRYRVGSAAVAAFTAATVSPAAGGPAGRSAPRHFRPRRRTHRSCSPRPAPPRRRVHRLRPMSTPRATSRRDRRRRPTRARRTSPPSRASWLVAALDCGAPLSVGRIDAVSPTAASPTFATETEPTT